MALNKRVKIELKDFALELAYEVGEFVKTYFHKLDKLEIQFKEAQGVVSRADTHTEELIIKRISEQFSDHKVLGEESSYGKLKTMKEFQNFVSQSDYCWVIDPIDGTSNFVAGLNYFGICLGLVYKQKPVLGVVYRPMTDELYYGVKGDGAFKIQGKGKSALALTGPSAKTSLQNSLVVTGFRENGVVHQDDFSILKAVMAESRGIRRMGSAALDMCHVAEGVFGGFWEHGLSPWDVTAASVICSEAGVRITDWKGEEFNPFQKNILVCSKLFHKQMLDLIDFSQ